MSNSTDTSDASYAALQAAADAAFRYYAYDPNLVLPIIVAALFGIASLGHIVLMIRKRSWYVRSLFPWISLTCPVARPGIVILYEILTSNSLSFLFRSVNL